MTYSVKDIQERYGVGEHTVLGWIRLGDLRAVNVSRQLGRRPNWRVTEEALQDFELLRSPTTVPKRTRRRRRPTDVIEFYK